MPPPRGARLRPARLQESRTSLGKTTSSDSRGPCDSRSLPAADELSIMARLHAAAGRRAAEKPSMTASGRDLALEDFRVGRTVNVKDAHETALGPGERMVN